MAPPMFSSEYAGCLREIDTTCPRTNTSQTGQKSRLRNRSPSSISAQLCGSPFLCAGAPQLARHQRVRTMWLTWATLEKSRDCFTVTPSGDLLSYLCAQIRAMLTHVGRNLPNARQTSPGLRRNHPDMIKNGPNSVCVCGSNWGQRVRATDAQQVPNRPSRVT